MIKVTDRVWYYPFDDAKDRPVLGPYLWHARGIGQDSGKPPDGAVDQDQMDRLIDMVERIDFEHALTGHWEPCSKEQLLANMRGNVYS